MSLNLRVLMATLIKNPIPPRRGSSSFFAFSPGFRCASLLQLTLQDKLWAKLLARLRRLVYRSAGMLYVPGFLYLN